MKFFIDFFPVAIFVGVYVFSKEEQPMYPAVVGLMIATFIQNIATRLLTGKFEKLHLWTLVITVVFGSMTLLFRDPAFIFWKASVLLWVTAIVFLYRQHVLGKILLKEMLIKSIGEDIPAPESLWSKLNHIWSFAYLVIGFINLYVAYNYSEAFWVQFKLFGLMGLNIVLLGYIMSKIYPYLPVEEKNEEKQTDNSDNQNKVELEDKTQTDNKHTQKDG